MFFRPLKGFWVMVGLTKWLFLPTMTVGGKLELLPLVAVVMTSRSGRQLPGGTVDRPCARAFRCAYRLRERPQPTRKEV